MKLFVENGQIYGIYTLTKHQYTCHRLFNNIQGKTMILWETATAIFTRYGSIQFFFFPRLKTTTKGHFVTTDHRKQSELTAIPLSVSQKCFLDWKKRWHDYDLSDGDHFEGDK